MLFYIDPGTGSMLFTILIGIISAAIYFFRDSFIKIRFLLSGGAQHETENTSFPFVIFTDSKRYWNIFGPVCREFEAKGQALTYMTASPDDPALTEQFEHVHCEFIGEGNKAFAKLNMLKADILVSSTPGLEVYQWKRSRDVKYYVHVPHGANDPAMYRMFGLDYYDAVLCSGEYQIQQIRKLEELRHLPKKDLYIAGLIYMDELKARLESAPPLPCHETTVLLAPSWGKSAIFSRFGGQIIDRLLQTGYHIIVRPHPQSYTSDKTLLDAVMAQYPASEQLEWNRDNDNFDVLRRSDILISDFSGVIFDFSLVFDKPIIYADTSYDKSPYDACWLEEEMWTFEVLPKIGMQLTSENMGDLKSIIDDCMASPSFASARALAREETWEKPGQGVRETVDYLINKYQELHPAYSDKLVSNDNVS